MVNSLNLSGMEATDICEILHEKCKVHDWTFMMADDSRAYHAGLKEADEMEYIRGVLDAMDFGTTANTIIDGWKPPSLKTKGYLV
jgi:hypothetical protein